MLVYLSGLGVGYGFREVMIDIRPPLNQGGQKGGAVESVDR